MRRQFAFLRDASFVIRLTNSCKSHSVNRDGYLNANRMLSSLNMILPRLFSPQARFIPMPRSGPQNAQVGPFRFLPPLTSPKPRHAPPAAAGAALRLCHACLCKNVVHRHVAKRIPPDPRAFALHHLFHGFAGLQHAVEPAMKRARHDVRDAVQGVNF